MKKRLPLETDLTEVIKSFVLDIELTESKSYLIKDFCKRGLFCDCYNLEDVHSIFRIDPDHTYLLINNVGIIDFWAGDFIHEKEPFYYQVHAYCLPSVIENNTDFIVEEHKILEKDSFIRLCDYFLPFIISKGKIIDKLPLLMAEHPKLVGFALEIDFDKVTPIDQSHIDFRTE